MSGTTCQWWAVFQEKLIGTLQGKGFNLGGKWKD